MVCRGKLCILLVYRDYIFTDYSFVDAKSMYIIVCIDYLFRDQWCVERNTIIVFKDYEYRDFWCVDTNSVEIDNIQ